jgi:hypothetical protein
MKILLICEYYGFAKELKNNKYNKEQIIDFLVSFESDQNNSDIVLIQSCFLFDILLIILISI